MAKIYHDKRHIINVEGYKFNLYFKIYNIILDICLQRFKIKGKETTHDKRNFIKMNELLYQRLHKRCL